MSDPLQKGMCRVVGLRQVLRAIREGKAQLVYLADDASDTIRQDVMKEAQTHQIPLQKIATMRSLARMCSVDVPASAAAIIKDTQNT